MRLNISTKESRFSVEMSDEHCRDKFAEIIELILKKHEAKEKADVILTAKNLEMPELFDSEPKKLYKGFLYIECDSCHESKGFCTKSGIKSHHCSCGKDTELNDMRYMQFQCECGKIFSYQTNKKVESFDIECINCGAPVAIMWNEKKGMYENM